MFHRTHGKWHKGLLRKYGGPFLVEQRVGNIAYRVKLPAHWECHPVFHVRYLVRWKGRGAELKLWQHKEIVAHMKPNCVHEGVVRRSDKERDVRIVCMCMALSQWERNMRAKAIKWRTCATAMEPAHLRA
ncbi:hypothetical protein GH714_038259 [Hevea brasiliensis]|uniref:Tf2-1-like SH3-like domain-containing protein n=1 Tax=Hevea brasiliensis TaxID=3981 RepID=A0A6A6MRD2_HEVBR|nr:hypothetical protein GH714_038259 [Hevea brasiliensis]